MISEHEKITQVDIETEMKSAYIDYAMSVIVARALPDVRDGLKPVHRRILYAMNDMGLFYNTSYKKWRLVGIRCYGASGTALGNALHACRRTG